MTKHLKTPSVIDAAGTGGKIIKEFFGAVNSGDTNVSIAMMQSPSGWKEPGQTPEFDEYTVVLKGVLNVQTKSQEYQVSEGEAILISKGEWVQYSTPHPDGAKYIAICLPAFSPDIVHRDE